MGQHFYTKTGESAFFQPKKDGSGNRPTTIRDVRALGLLPSPTTILSVLAKPALQEWLIRTAVTAVVTAPSLNDAETIDDKIKRVLDVERQQDSESEKAKDTGTKIHEALELSLAGKQHDPEWSSHIGPAIDAVRKLGRVVATEKVMVNADVGYAGKTDCITESDEWFHIVDFKTAKNLPDRDAWPEARIQASAYAGALGNTGDKMIACTLIYISTTEPGKIAVFTYEDWSLQFRQFKLLLEFWQLANNITMNKPLPF